MYLLFKLGARSLALLPGRNKVLGWIKQGGGPDSACGPSVRHLCLKPCCCLQLQAPIGLLCLCRFAFSGCLMLSEVK